MPETMFRSDPEREARLLEAARGPVSEWLSRHESAVSAEASLRLTGVNDGISTLVVDCLSGDAATHEYLEFKVGPSGQVLNVHAYTEGQEGPRSRRLSLRPSRGPDGPGGRSRG